MNKTEFIAYVDTQLPSSTGGVTAEKIRNVIKELAAQVYDTAPHVEAIKTTLVADTPTTITFDLAFDDVNYALVYTAIDNEGNQLICDVTRYADHIVVEAAVDVTFEFIASKPTIDLT